MIREKDAISQFYLCVMEKKRLFYAVGLFRGNLFLSQIVILIRTSLY